MTDLIFLKALKEKLKGGNTKSIHLNVLPGRFATRLDLGNLNYIKPNLAESFLELILGTANFEFKISYDGIELNTLQVEEQKKLGLLSKRLNSLNIENDDNYKEHGIKTFGFGYPILIKPSKQDPRKLIKAPLFIWQLELVKATNKVNTWSILRNKVRNENGKIVDEEIHSVGLNEVLLSFLKTDENIIIPQINEELLEDAIINKKELIYECFKVLKALNANTSEGLKASLSSKLSEAITNIPEAATLESSTNNHPWIHFGGVFGLFRTQKESIITDLDRIIENFEKFDFENLTIEEYRGTPHSAVETDPSQQGILSTLVSEPNKIIQGPPGTGKSQTLTALITNALANNLKCLVVCEKKTALDVIKNNLFRENEQLASLVAVIEDINKDRDGIVNSVRDRIAVNSQRTYFNKISYDIACQNLQKSVSIVNNQHAKLEKKIYRGKSWTELVGEFLQLQKVADYLPLKTKLDYKQFKFNDDENELTEFNSKIKTAKRLYAEIQRLDHPLEILSDSVFTDENPMGIQLHMEELIARTSENLENLKSELQAEVQDYKTWLNAHYVELVNQIVASQKKLEDEIESYKNWLDIHYADYYNSVKQEINLYLAFAKSNGEQFGDLFYKNDQLSKAFITVLSLVSAKYKTLRNNRIELINKISNIKQIHLNPGYIEHEYVDITEIPTLKIYVENIELLNQESDKWYEKIAEVKSNYLNTMYSGNLHLLYSEHNEEISLSENTFNEIILVLSNDKQLSVSAKKHKTHTKKLHEYELILKQFNEINEIINHYIDVFSASDLHFYNAENKISIESSENKFTGLCSSVLAGNFLERGLSDSQNHNKKINEINQLLSELKVISDHLEEFRGYYYWRRFIIELTELQKTVIKSVIETGVSKWEAIFTSWYYYWLLSLNEHQELPKNEESIIDLIEAKGSLRNSQISNIISTWNQKQVHSINRLNHSHGAVRTLYNQRGAAGHKRNSLRKIIRSDIEFFTDFFPVLMVSPTTCSSIIPLKEGLFDIVLFDEASQLRIEDTFPALIRGKIKIVSGDSQQMPPPSYFQGGASLLNPTEEDNDEEPDDADETKKRTFNNSFELANCESLLDFAETSGYKPSMLKIHYRSQHPHLIDFSNHAFYGKRLIPMPAKNEYKSIQFIEVNGVYEDQTNKDEARQVVDILLNHIKPKKDGNYPSVGVATFNLYQRNLILEEIAKARQINPEHDKKITDLGSNFFVKNLENIQGDERDIIILSTTFGKRTSGSFGQNFGPISNKTKGYKLLNVIITRAKYKVYVCSSIPNEYIQQYAQLIKNEFSGNSIFYSYLAYSKAISSSNFELAKQILDEVHQNSPHQSYSTDTVDPGSESPFEEEVYNRLTEMIGFERIEQQYRVGGFRLDMVIKSKQDGKPIIAIECDGAKYHSSNEAYAWDLFRQSQIEKQGYKFHRIWSTNWWYSPENELTKLVAFILQTDQLEIQQNNGYYDESIETEEIKAVTEIKESQKIIGIHSKFAVKNPEGQILKMKFSKTAGKVPIKANADGYYYINIGTPMAQLFMGKTEGEICQLGMLEYYYEVLEIE